MNNTVVGVDLAKDVIQVCVNRATELGHTVRLISTKLVASIRQIQKNNVLI